MHSGCVQSYLLWGMAFLWSEIEIMTGDVHNHLRDIHTVEYSTPTKIKILRVFNDMGNAI